MIDYYIKKGYTLEQIEARIKAIITRKKLTKTWGEKEIQDTKEYAILTNEIYKTWSGMKANEYKKYKGGEIAKNTQNDIESKRGEPVNNKRNNLKYQHSKDKGFLIISNIK